MAEIKFPVAYRVNVVEYDIDMGSKIAMVEYFDNELEVRNWCDRYNASNADGPAPDWYIQAEFVGKIC